jgi:DNA-binding FadR family transcriptional regulator
MSDALKGPDAYIEVDLDFHLALAEAAQNRRNCCAYTGR